MSKPINEFKILAPRWKDKTVLLASWKEGAWNKIVIEAKHKDGSPYYPEPFYASAGFLKKFPIEKVGNHLMRVVPLTALEENAFNQKASDAIDNWLKE